jgi:hypothetical protein
MVRRLHRDGMLPQFYAAEVIQRRFGGAFVSQDERGLLAIHESVVREFLRAVGEPVKWDARRRFWYVEQPADLEAADPNDTLPYVAA